MCLAVENFVDFVDCPYLKICPTKLRALKSFFSLRVYTEADLRKCILTNFKNKKKATSHEN